MRVREARAGESKALSAIAFAAKAHWGYPASALESWRQDLAVSEDSIARRPTFVGEASGEIAGFYQLVLEDGEWSLEHLWVHPAFMKMGFGRSLLAHAAQQAASLGAGLLLIDADPNAERFYLACGAVRSGEVAAPIEGQPDRVRPQLRLDVAAS